MQFTSSFIGTLTSALDALQNERSINVPCLSHSQCATLLSYLPILDFRDCIPIVGVGDKQVTQDFTLCMEFPDDDPFRAFAHDLTQALMSANALTQCQPLTQDFVLNDCIVQKYLSNSNGMSAHRDHLRYRSLVVLMLLEGESHFYTCDDRTGVTGRKLTTANTGDLILMPAPGFRDADSRPFHFVTGLKKKRISFGMRFDAQI